MAGNTNSFLELLVDSSWNETEGTSTLLELGERELDWFTWDSVEIWLEVIGLIRFDVEELNVEPLSLILDMLELGNNSDSSCLELEKLDIFKDWESCSWIDEGSKLEAILENSSELANVSELTEDSSWTGTEILEAFVELSLIEMDNDFDDCKAELKLEELKNSVTIGDCKLLNEDSGMAKNDVLDDLEELGSTKLDKNLDDFPKDAKEEKLELSGNIWNWAIDEEELPESLIELRLGELDDNWDELWIGPELKDVDFSCFVLEDDSGTKEAKRLEDFLELAILEILEISGNTENCTWLEQDLMNDDDDILEDFVKGISTKLEDISDDSRTGTEGEELDSSGNTVNNKLLAEDSGKAGEEMLEETCFTELEADSWTKKEQEKLESSGITGNANSLEDEDWIDKDEVIEDNIELDLIKLESNWDDFRLRLELEELDFSGNNKLLGEDSGKADEEMLEETCFTELEADSWTKKEQEKLESSGITGNANSLEDEDWIDKDEVIEDNIELDLIKLESNWDDFRLRLELEELDCSGSTWDNKLEINLDDFWAELETASGISFWLELESWVSIFDDENDSEVPALLKDDIELDTSDAELTSDDFVSMLLDEKEENIMKKQDELLEDMLDSTFELLSEAEDLNDCFKMLEDDNGIRLLTDFWLSSLDEGKLEDFLREPDDGKKLLPLEEIWLSLVDMGELKENLEIPDDGDEILALEEILLLSEDTRILDRFELPDDSSALLVLEEIWLSFIDGELESSNEILLLEGIWLSLVDEGELSNGLKMIDVDDEIVELEEILLSSLDKNELEDNCFVLEKIWLSSIDEKEIEIGLEITDDDDETPLLTEILIPPIVEELEEKTAMPEEAKEILLLKEIWLSFVEIGELNDKLEIADDGDEILVLEEIWLSAKDTGKLVDCLELPDDSDVLLPLKDFWISSLEGELEDSNKILLLDEGELSDGLKMFDVADDVLKLEEILLSSLDRNELEDNRLVLDDSNEVLLLENIELFSMVEEEPEISSEITDDNNEIALLAEISLPLITRELEEKSVVLEEGKAILLLEEIWFSFVDTDELKDSLEIIDDIEEILLLGDIWLFSDDEDKLEEILEISDDGKIILLSSVNEEELEDDLEISNDGSDFSLLEEIWLSFVDEGVLEDSSVTPEDNNIISLLEDISLVERDEGLEIPDSKILLLERKLLSAVDKDKLEESFDIVDDDGKILLLEEIWLSSMDKGEFEESLETPDDAIKIILLKELSVSADVNEELEDNSEMNDEIDEILLLKELWLSFVEDSLPSSNDGMEILPLEENRLSFVDVSEAILLLEDSWFPDRDEENWLSCFDKVKLEVNESLLLRELWISFTDKERLDDSLPTFDDDKEILLLDEIGLGFVDMSDDCNAILLLDDIWFMDMNEGELGTSSDMSEDEDERLLLEENWLLCVGKEKLEDNLENPDDATEILLLEDSLENPDDATEISLLKDSLENPDDATEILLLEELWISSVDKREVEESLKSPDDGNEIFLLEDIEGEIFDDEDELDEIGSL